MDSVSVMAAQARNQAEESKLDTMSVYSHQTGVSQVSAVTYATDMLGITAETSFLLLYLREPEDYNLWRIKEALNFPAPNICRDRVIPELYRFKNQPNKLIICYMLDERSGSQYAQLLSEKGFDNVFLLSGGCEQFLEEFSELCEGKQVPIPKSKIAAEQQALAEAKAAERKAKHQQKIMTKF